MRPQRLLLLAFAACLLLGSLAWFFGRPGGGGAKGGSRPLGMESIRLSMPGQDEVAESGAPAAAAADEPAREKREKKEERVQPPPQDRESIDRSLVAPAEPAEPPPRAVYGRLIGPGDKPIHGALVLAALRDESRPWPLDARALWEREPARAFTGPDGRFAITGLAPGALRLAVRQEGCIDLDLDELWLPADGVDLGDLRLWIGIPFEGRVLDEKGRGLPGATLVVLDPSLPKPTSEWNERCGAPVAVSAIDGSFRTLRIRPGPWRILVSHPERPAELFEGTLEAKGRAPRLDMQLRKGAQTTGQVSGLPPVPRFVARAAPVRRLVRAYDPHVALADELEYCAGYTQAFVDVRGAFAIPGLEPRERYVLRVLREDQRLGAEDAFAAWQSVVAGQHAVVAHSPGGVLACGVRDLATDRPLTQLTLEWDRAHPKRNIDAGGAELRVQPDGRVLWEGIRPQAEYPMVPGFGRVTSVSLSLLVEAAGYERKRVDGITFAPGELVDLRWLVLAPLPTLRVRVVADESSAPVPGATVEVGPTFAGADERVHRARTDASGMARIAVPQRGDAVVRASSSGRAAASALVPEALDALQLRLAKEASVVVQVLDHGNNALVAAEVVRVLRGRDPTAFEVDGELISERQPVDSAGQAAFTGLEPGPHAFAARLLPRLGFPAENRARSFTWTEVNVHAGERTSIVLYTAGLGSIEGEVRIGRDDLAGAMLELRLRDPNWPWSTAFGGGWTPTAFPALASADERGRFAFWRLAAGEYGLVVRHPASETVTHRLLRIGPGPRRVRFDVRDTSVRGTAFTGGESLAQGVEVRVYPEAPALDDETLRPGFWFSRLTEREPLLRTRANASGVFVFPAFPADIRCEVVVVDSDWTGAESVEVKQGSSAELQLGVEWAGRLEIWPSGVPKSGDVAIGVIAVRPEEPLVSGTRVAVVDNEDPEIYWDLAPGVWKVRACSLYEAEIVTELGPWTDVKIERGRTTRLRLQWPPKE